MTNNEFGKRIVQLRKEKGFTQKELADKLNVSDKAVSRWETGKNYPDIETLQQLATALDVSVNDLLSGELKLAKKVSKRKKTIVVTLVILLMVYLFPVWHLIPVTAVDFYSAYDVSYLLFRGLPTNRIQVSNIIDTAETAFSDIESTENEAKEKYEVLSRYATASDDYRGAITENHKLRIWSVILNPSPTAEYRGYMWVYYSREVLDKDGNVVRGAWRVPALWYLDKDDHGEWYVKDIKEGP